VAEAARGASGADERQIGVRRDSGRVVQ
jgi:hypothetical protein